MAGKSRMTSIRKHAGAAAKRLGEHGVPSEVNWDAAHVGMSNAMLLGNLAKVMGARGYLKEGMTPDAYESARMKTERRVKALEDQYPIETFAGDVAGTPLAIATLLEGAGIPMGLGLFGLLGQPEGADQMSSTEELTTRLQNGALAGTLGSAASGMRGGQGTRAPLQRPKKQKGP